MDSQKNLQVPSDWVAGLRENFTADILSGFTVSLLALPLSLGIAAASDFPNPMYGVLTAIVGGILVSLLAGSRMTIKGPAAGLIVIVAGSVSAFGGGEMGWRMTLGAIVVAAVFQVLFGLFKLGKLADFFPLSAVHGMLAAIGLIILSKQLHILLGVNPLTAEKKPIVEPLELIEALPHTFAQMGQHIPIIITGLVCLALVLGLPLIKNATLKKIPVPMIVLLVAIPLGMFLDLKSMKGLVEFKGSFVDLLGFNVSFEGYHQTGTFIKYVVLFALIGSLESLLTAKAIDMMDPYKRKSDFNQDLVAVGAGNILAGVLGGLPMISEVARSSANINNGGKTRWANFFHGVFLLIFMLLLTSVIQLIPKAALAAMLMGVGIKLAHPREFIHVYHYGKEQLAVFVITIIATLCTDLLIGIGAGIAFKLVLQFYNGASIGSLFSAPTKVLVTGDKYVIEVSDAAVFTNYLSLKSKIDAIPAQKNIIIDLSKTKVVDHTVMKNMSNFKKEYVAGGGTFELVGLEAHESFSDHELSARRIAK